MAIKTPDWDFVQPQYVAALRNFIALTDQRAQILLTAAAGQRFKLQVVTAGLSDVAADNGLKGASPTAWRYLAQAGGHAVAAEVTLGTPRITTLIDGPAADQAFAAIAALHQNNDLQASDFNLVHLRAAGVRVEAYWLRPTSAGGAPEHVVPFTTPLNNALKPGYGAKQLLSPADFIGAIRPTAQMNLKFYGGDLNRSPTATAQTPQGTAKPQST
jgi:hypothetical protein